MNYPEELRDKYNEIMYDERDVIESFLKKQYDIRYGNQRDMWHIEPAVKMMARDGSTVLVHDIKLDKDRFVIFLAENSKKEVEELECFDFAYGELSEVIEALPDADDIVWNVAINDIRSKYTNIKALLSAHPFSFVYGGFEYKCTNVSFKDGDIDSLEFANASDMPICCLHVEDLTALRDHINIESLHSSDEYKRLKKILSCEANFYSPEKYGDVLFTIDNTDMEVNLTSATLDENGKMTLCVQADNDEEIHIEEKDIKKEYLEAILSHIESTCDIIDTCNGHDPELVRKINDAWRDDRYHDNFEGILHALLERDYEEYCDKFEVPEVTTSDYAMNHAHEIMEGVCDDLDLQTILSFIRYEL